ncbi:MAG: hypothetical protein ABH828_05110 [archaeon]
MSDKEEILRIVKAKGPVIPNEIKKQVGGDTYVISAILSELSQDGLIKISHTKIGGSPTYYAPGQEFKLQELKKYLNEKDQKTFDLLKAKKVLRDKNQEMLIRVSLRNIIDFAKPLKVNIHGEKEIFWKWYLTPLSEVESIIRKKSPTPSPKKAEPEQIIKEEGPEIKQEEKEIQKEETQKVIKKDAESKEGFLGQVYDYFKEKNIEVVSENIIRKKTDLEFEVMVPSSVGKVQYYCKAKNKKKCTDGDLSSVYLKAQSLKLPVLFLTTGDVTKKASEMLDKEFKGLVLKKI